LQAGHAWGDIRHYTLAQFKLFLAAAARRQAREAAKTLGLVALGAQGEGDNIKEAIEDLERRARAK